MPSRTSDLSSRGRSTRSTRSRDGSETSHRDPAVETNVGLSPRRRSLHDRPLVSPGTHRLARSRPPVTFPARTSLRMDADGNEETAMTRTVRDRRRWRATGRSCWPRHARSGPCPARPPRAPERGPGRGPGPVPGRRRDGDRRRRGPQPLTAREMQVLAASNAFGLELFRHVSALADGDNVLLSPSACPWRSP